MNAFRIIGAASIAGVVVAIAVLAGTAAAQYSGSQSVFAFFSLSFLVLAALIAPKPRVYAYSFFAAFMLLGFWTKAAIQIIWHPVFAEPVGAFSGTPQEWDSALLAAGWAALGTAAARILHLIFARTCNKQGANSGEPRAPDWYIDHKRYIWLASIAIVVALNAANYYHAFYKIGTSPLLILPLHLNVVVAWLINLGLAMWLATLVFWDIRHRPGEFPKSAPLPFLEALVTSISAASRGMYLFHAVPYFIALTASFRGLGAKSRRRELDKVALWLGALFVLSMGVVFWQRMATMHGEDTYSRPPAEVAETYRSDLINDLPYLVIRRWVGLEGVFAVEAAPDRGKALLYALITDSPAKGADSLYQSVAKVGFARESGKLYLSNAGIVAILHAAGSSVVIFSGMLVIGLVLVLTEAVAERWTGNALLVGISGAGLANVVIQTTFPYLTLVFLVQLLTTIGFLAFIQRTGTVSAPTI